LKTALETLWQPPYEEQGLGLHLEEEEEEEGEEEVVVEDNQLLSLHNSSFLSHQLLIYKSWKCFPTSLKEKETRWTPS